MLNTTNFSVLAKKFCRLITDAILCHSVIIVPAHSEITIVSQNTLAALSTKRPPSGEPYVADMGIIVYQIGQSLRSIIYDDKLFVRIILPLKIAYRFWNEGAAIASEHNTGDQRQH